MATREQIALLTEELDVTEALLAAKKAYRSDASDKNLKKMNEAKAAARDWAERMRTKREAERPEPGVARPASVQGAKAKAG